MPENLKNLLGILAAILIATLVVLVGFEIKSRAGRKVDITKTPTISLSAEGKVSASPDTATISFSAVTQGGKAEDVQEENDRKMAQVIDYLKASGIEEKDIQTSGYNLYPRYDYSKPPGEPPTITGYTLSQQVTAKVRDLASVSKIVGGLTSRGVNQIDNVSFSIDDPDKLKSEARQLAIAKAKEKAQELAAGLGVKLGRVINFSEGQVLVPTYLRAFPEGAGGGGGSPLEPGSQEVTVTVTLTFELK